MQGDIGTEDDFVTPRPDTLKMTAPGSTLNDERMPGLQPAIQAGATWALWTGMANNCF